MAEEIHFLSSPLGRGKLEVNALSFAAQSHSGGKTKGGGGETKSDRTAGRRSARTTARITNSLWPVPHWICGTKMRCSAV